MNHSPEDPEAPSPDRTDGAEPERTVSRRTLFSISGAAALGGTTVGVTAEGLVSRASRTRQQSIPGPEPRLAAADMSASWGDLPVGLADPVPAFGILLAFDLTPAARRDHRSARAAAADFLRDVSRLPGPTATGPGPAGLDLTPANLQVTPGVGATLLTAAGVGDRRPDAFVDLPRFAVDRLDERLCGGDLVVQVGAEDPMRLAGAVQQVLALAGDHVRLRWSRSGFRATSAASRTPEGAPRNLMGHRDGSANPRLGTPLWDYTVRVRTAGWMADGSYLVVRQVRMDLDRWFAHGVAARDRVIGRDTATGAPLGGHDEFETADLAAHDASGSLVIPPTAHLRLANQVNTRGARLYRRSWNYDDGFDADGRRRAGLVFLAWQNDIRRGFTPIQQSLDAGHDALSDYLAHIGSAVFAMPGRGDDYPGQSLLED